MNPVPYVEVEKLSKVKRNVLCANYDKCLDIAIANNWRGFACEECNDFKALQWNLMQWHDDATACAKIIQVIHDSPWLLPLELEEMSPEERKRAIAKL